MRKPVRSVSPLLASALMFLALPAEMCMGWWWIRDPEELEATLRALHPRGIREKALHKHLSKHRDFLREVCLRPPTGECSWKAPESLCWGSPGSAPSRGKIEGDC